MSISVTWKKYTRYSNKLYCVVCVISRPCLCVSIIPGKNERGFPTYKEIVDTFFYRGFDIYYICVHIKPQAYYIYIIIYCMHVYLWLYLLHCIYITCIYILTLRWLITYNVDMYNCRHTGVYRQVTSRPPHQHQAGPIIGRSVLKVILKLAFTGLLSTKRWR